MSTLLANADSVHDRPGAPRITPSPRADQQRNASERRLERAALELFLQSGYDSVTVEQIARAAGLSPRTFFRHFPTKADLFTASARRHYDQVCDEMERRPRFEPTFKALCEAMVSGARFDPEDRELDALRRQLLTEQPELYDKLRAEADPMGDRLTLLVAERLGVDPTRDMTAALVVRLARGAARTAQDTWIARAGTAEGAQEEALIDLIREAFALVSGAEVLERAADHERAQALRQLG